MKKVIAVVGLGLIGGSLAAALRGFEDYEVVGVARRQETVDYALEHNICDRATLDAGDALAERFRTVEFAPMAFPVLFNCLGHEMGESDTIPALLEKQVQSSVYMEDTIRRLEQLGVDTIVEIGPGKALSGFVKKTVPEVPVYAVETAADVEALVNAVKENA